MFEICFQNLGKESTLTDDLFAKLQQYVAVLYGTKEKSVDEACWKIFDMKHHRENKIIDMPSLPPCTTVLR